jgi:hypothetical protein
MRRDFSWLFSVLGSVIVTLAIVALARRLLSEGLSAPLALVLDSYRELANLLFGWIPAPFGYAVPDWYRYAWLPAVLLMGGFARTFVAQGGRLTVMDVPYLIVGSIVLMGFILSVGGMARYIVHRVRGDHEGAAEERAFALLGAGSILGAIAFVAINAGMKLLSL